MNFIDDRGLWRLLLDYKNFLNSVLKDENATTITEIYHLVRNIPYGSNGNRDPREVYKTKVGSCSGKHTLLRDLLRQAGYKVEIITMFTHFNKSCPVHETYPPELKKISQNSEIPDFHHYVRVFANGKWVKLDATWHDGMLPYGFVVNNEWNGVGDTHLASVPLHEYPNEEELTDFKKNLVASLSDEDRQLRLRYFTLVTHWISGLEKSC